MSENRLHGPEIIAAASGQTAVSPVCIPRRAVVFASGRGSGFEALLKHRIEGRLAVELEALVTNVPGCGAVALAQRAGLPVIELPHAGRTRALHESEITAALLERGFDLAGNPSFWVVLAGYMRLFSPSFVRSLWRSELHAARMVNIHPSLLPSFPGVDGYGQALAHGVKVSGATVHLVSEGLDDGPIVAQQSFDLQDDDTVDTVTARGLAVEHRLYATALHSLASRPWSVVVGPGQRPRVLFLKNAKEESAHESR